MKNLALIISLVFYFGCSKSPSANAPQISEPQKSGEDSSAEKDVKPSTSDAPDQTCSFQTVKFPRTTKAYQPEVNLQIGFYRGRSAESPRILFRPLEHLESVYATVIYFKRIDGDLQFCWEPYRAEENGELHFIEQVCDRNAFRKGAVSMGRWWIESGALPKIDVGGNYAPEDISASISLGSYVDKDFLGIVRLVETSEQKLDFILTQKNGDIWKSSISKEISKIRRNASGCPDADISSVQE